MTDNWMGLDGMDGTELFIHNIILKYTLQIYKNIINYTLKYYFIINPDLSSTSFRSRAMRLMGFLIAL